VVEHLPSKCEALNSKPQTEKKEEEKDKEEKEEKEKEEEQKNRQVVLKVWSLDQSY
jgi:hypothetical protein